MGYRVAIPTSVPAIFVKLLIKDAFFRQVTREMRATPVEEFVFPVIAEAVEPARAVVVHPHRPHHPVPLPLLRATGHAEAVVLADVQPVTAVNVIPPLEVDVRGTLDFVTVVDHLLLPLIPVRETPAQEPAATTGVVLLVL